jgi:hypothetical protein
MDLELVCLYVKLNSLPNKVSKTKLIAQYVNLEAHHLPSIVFSSINGGKVLSFLAGV